MPTTCPKCEYKHYVIIDGKAVFSGIGEFFEVTSDHVVRAERGRFPNTERKMVLGCPSCGTIFIDVSD